MRNSPQKILKNNVFCLNFYAQMDVKKTCGMGSFLVKYPLGDLSFFRLPFPFVF
jgi:hypothetical protein